FFSKMKSEPSNMGAQNEQSVVDDFFCTSIIYFLILRNKEKVEGLTFPVHFLQNTSFFVVN
ncbi:MAG: hypothetical protein IKP56_00535, partial [Bacilli bacterium]|nr:hypothetical protein [Bacilli bacterium]